MNEKLKRLFLVYLIFGVPLLYNHYGPSIKRGYVFDHLKHKEKCTKKLIMISMGSKGYFARGEYDLDGDGKSDVVAFYKIEDQDLKGTYYYSSRARFLWNDKNEDGLIRCVLEDSDENGTLEKPLKRRKLREFLEDLNKPREFEL